jgi:DNA-binding MarR family transcriptional regulator
MLGGVSGPRWLTGAQQQAWRKLAAVTALLPAALDAQLQRDAELTHFGYWVLAMLSEAPCRALRMHELAAASNASLSRLSHVVAKLEERGWVRRERAADDGRGSVAVLTGAGWDKVAASAPGHVDTVRALVFDGLTDAQVGQLDRLCDALLERLDPDHRLAVTATARCFGPSG